MRTSAFAVTAAAMLIGSAAAAEGGKGAKEAAPNKAVAVADTAWQPLDPKKPDGPQIASLWGKADKAPYGFLLKVKAGTQVPRHSHTYSYDGVVVQGEWKHTYGDETDAAPLPAGSHWHQVGKQVHGDGCVSTSGECIVLISYPSGKRDFILAPEAKK